MSDAVVLALVMIVAAGCTSTGGARNSYGDDLAKLEQQCRVREGILTPIPGANTGQASTDYACTIHGGGTRIQP